jgi:hypothetical protein
MVAIHETVITAWAADLNRENTFIRGDINPIEPVFDFMDDLFNLLRGDL